MNTAFDPSRHIPVKSGEIPEKEFETDEDAHMHDRPDIPPPSAYARAAVVTNRRTKVRAVVHRVDLITRQLRLWYPDRKDLPLRDQFDTRTGWQSFDDWEPEITFSAEEIERQEAKRLFAEELLAFDADGLSLVTVFCDDADPVKALAKIRALKKSNLVRMKDEAPVQVADMSPPAEPITTTKKGK